MAEFLFYVMVFLCSKEVIQELTTKKEPKPSQEQIVRQEIYNKLQIIRYEKAKTNVGNYRRLEQSFTAQQESRLP